MSYKTYAEKLKDPRWQKKRLEILDAADWKCQSDYCQSEPNTTLHVHHKIYIKGNQPWEYEDWAYKVLCGPCHKLQQAFMDKSSEVLAKNDLLCEALSNLSNDKDAMDSFVSLCYTISFWKPKARERALHLAHLSLNSFEEAYALGHLDGKNEKQ